MKTVYNMILLNSNGKNSSLCKIEFMRMSINGLHYSYTLPSKQIVKDVDVEFVKELVYGKGSINRMFSTYYTLPYASFAEMIKRCYVGEIG